MNHESFRRKIVPRAPFNFPDLYLHTMSAAFLMITEFPFFPLLSVHVEEWSFESDRRWQRITSLDVRRFDVVRECTTAQCNGEVFTFPLCLINELFAYKAGKGNDEKCSSE